MLIKRQPTASEKALKFEFSIKGSKFLVKNFTDEDIYVDLGENENKAGYSWRCPKTNN